MVSKKSFTLLVEKRNNTDFHKFLIIFAQHCSPPDVRHIFLNILYLFYSEDTWLLMEIVVNFQLAPSSTTFQLYEELRQILYNVDHVEEFKPFIVRKGSIRIIDRGKKI